jgi:flavin reductase (DIM6/NTAB) family NADH-FMN oxidoreductase RutF
MDTNTFRHLSYGVYIISTWDGERPTGCTANSAMQITSQPATIALSINHDNFTNGCIEKSGLFAINILAEDSDSALIGRFGFQSGRDVDKFAGITHHEFAGLPVLADTCGYIVCKVINKMETATHTVFLGEVLDAEVARGGEAMTYAYYHRVVKGKAPKNAPTYLPPVEEAPTAKKLVCSVCGYEYEGETLPADFKCPICGVGPEKFS